MPATKRIEARGLMWGADFVKRMVQNIESGVTVTSFVLGADDELPIEFEIVVTKVGDIRLPRKTTGTARTMR